MLRATTACTFLRSQLPIVVRTWCVLCILTSKRAPRHNSMQFFISHLASWPRTRRFSEPTFRPPGATNQWKNTMFCGVPTFSRAWIFFLLRLSLSSSLLFSDSSHLCFSSVQIVGSLTSKLPSIIQYIYIPHPHGAFAFTGVEAGDLRAGRLGQGEGIHEDRQLKMICAAETGD